MASYSELFDLRNYTPLKNKVVSACAIAANGIVNDAAPPANQTQRLKWAAQAIRNPEATADELFWSLLAQNEALSVAAIQAASDSAIQTAVENTVDLFADQLV